ncbi:unnamed protein product [Mytilus edulis]|uniref:Reverse transcriptase domain-containing protein n=1 Tax=Mytilus edulis TaxID=6550 RepID=A0A8S3PSH4_MYTED|nr:unnamed protein product [Mytilus edulis]
MKFAKYELRKTCRIEIAIKVLNDRQEILDARTKHDQVFYKLLGKKKKGKLKNCISELNVQDNIYKSDNEIIVGWKQHFNKLAQPANDPEYDDEYYKQLALDLDNIIDICNNQTNTISVTEKDVQDAINGSVVKFNGLISEPFSICQGVKQGGILSADLYKLYINNLLTDIEHSGLGAKIGSICCAAPTCADDVALMSDNPEELQVLINMAYNYSQRERYKLQPVKSVILPVYPNRRKQQEPSFPWSIGNSIMPIVSQTTHMGVLRTSKPDDPNPLYEKREKARRAMYSLMPAGLHGKNGLDIQSLLHIFNIYVIPVLLYGLELVTPTGKNLDIIDIFHKKCIKQLLSLPTSTATPAIYILSGQLPIEGQIHKKILSLFGNISRQPQNSLEKQIAYRQLLMKTDDSNSWFIIVKTILAKYNLPSALYLLDSQIQKLKWKTMVNKEVSKYWKHFIEGHCKLYPSLKYLNSQYIPGKTHVLVNLSASNSMQEAMRIPVKLRIATGSYILMADRTRHSKNKGLLQGRSIH